MSTPTLKRETALDQLLGALSDRTRRALLRRLAEGPASVGNLAEPFDMSLAAVSKHLGVLEAAGLVRREVDGRVRRCHLVSDPLQDVGAWLETYRPFWDRTLANLARHAERRPRVERRTRKSARTK